MLKCLLLEIWNVQITVDSDKKRLRIDFSEAFHISSKNDSFELRCPACSNGLKICPWSKFLVDSSMDELLYIPYQRTKIELIDHTSGSIEHGHQSF